MATFRRCNKVEIYSAPLAYRELISFYANTQKACGIAFNTRTRTIFTLCLSLSLNIESKHAQLSLIIYAIERLIISR